MSGLVRCPLCGASEGYYLIDGSRWWKVACDACGQVIAEAPSTRDWKPPPKQCDSADAAWNAAGAHAQSLRDEIASVYAAIASVGARYLDPPDGGEVPIGEQVRRLAADAQSLRDRVAALEAALRGLVGVKDMRLRLIKLHEMGHGTDYTDYYRLKSLAWAAARAALEQKP